MIIEKKQITDLIPAPYNPRQSTAKQEKHLKESLEKFGMVEPIIFNKQTGYIVGGHFRVRELKKLGIKEIECVIVDLNEDDEKELNIRLNANTGSWDWDTLANDWEVVDLEAWGMEIPQFDNEAEELEASEDDYDVPEGGIETDIVIGDLFEIGEHRLLCGDSTDSDAVARLMNGEKADMVFTDPPYGMAYESNAWDSKKSEVKQKRTDTQILNDENTNVGQDALNLIPLFLENNRHFYIWCRWDCFNDFKEVCENIGKIKSVVVWDKGGPGLGDLKGSYGDSEWAIFGMIGRRELKERQNGVWQVNRMKGLQMQHPTQKPLEICERGINNSTNQNELILDLFLGSGSTMAASHQLKRKCYGMELDPKYCQVIVDRMIKLDPTLEVKRNGQPYVKTEA